MFKPADQISFVVPSSSSSSDESQQVEWLGRKIRLEKQKGLIMAATLLWTIVVLATFVYGIVLGRVKIINPGIAYGMVAGAFVGSLGVPFGLYLFSRTNKKIMTLKQEGESPEVRLQEDAEDVANMEKVD